MTIDTTKLRELAQNATPGPWEYSSWDINSFAIVVGFDSPGSTTGEMIVYPDASDEEGYGGVKLLNDAEYIAAANPSTVLALLDALDDAHRNMDDFGLLADKKTSECRSLINWVNDIAEDLSIPEDSVDGMSIGDAIFRLKQIEAAARNLAKVKGRHHSELAMNQLLEALK